MRFLSFTTSLVLALASFTVSARTAQEVKEKTAAAANAAVEFTQEQRAAFAQEMHDNLAEVSRQIAELRTQTGQKTEDKIKELETKKRAMEKKIEELDRATGKAWAKLHDGLKKTWVQMKSSFQDARDEIKK